MSLLANGTSDAVRSSLGADIALINTMFDSLSNALRDPSIASADSPTIMETVSTDGCQRRIAVYRPAVLMTTRQFLFAGFFGERRLTVDPETISEIGRVDRRMLVELDALPGIPAYCSFELANGNWGNLVVISDPAAFKALHTSEIHSYAASTLSPAFYTSVRLHKGYRSGLDPQDISVIERTKYYDFSEGSAAINTERSS